MFKSIYKFGSSKCCNILICINNLIIKYQTYIFELTNNISNIRKIQNSKWIISTQHMGRPEPL